MKNHELKDYMDRLFDEVKDIRSSMDKLHGSISVWKWILGGGILGSLLLTYML